ncbi:VOC family protein [Salsuginibacillus kocurii]|uniref:VOC family protein n=1 Tax=Salsuginibacillus kocurii TaxID=427078 RepID=UPI0003704E0C|nr:VOC family protein [Salsuginibacillus kocurii]
MSRYHRKPNTYVREVTLKVANLERSLGFYKDLLGLHVHEQTEWHATLSADAETPLLQLEQPNDSKPKQKHTTGLYHFALLLPSRTALASLFSRLNEQHYPLHGAADHDISNALYLDDPDGNGVELYVDTDPDTWVWHGGKIDVTSSPLDLRSLLNEAEDISRKGMPANTIMGHIHLHGADMKSMKEFYNQGIGFDIVVDNLNQMTFFSSGGYHHHVGVNLWNGVGAPPPAVNSVGMKEYTLVFPSKKDRQKAGQRLEELGYETNLAGESFYTTDPSSNVVRMVVASN